MTIKGIGPTPELPGGIEKNVQDKAAGADFGATLADAIEKVAEVQHEAENAIKGISTGDGTDVHTAMIAMEKANLSFQMMMQVRNKLVNAYEEIMRMQI